MVKNLPTVQETRVWSLGQEDPLGKGMATHSCSCLENSMDKGPWRATVHGVAELDMTEQLSIQHTGPSLEPIFILSPISGLLPLSPSCFLCIIVNISSFSCRVGTYYVQLMFVFLVHLKLFPKPWHGVYKCLLNTMNQNREWEELMPCWMKQEVTYGGGPCRKKLKSKHWCMRKPKHKHVEPFHVRRKNSK